MKLLLRVSHCLSTYVKGRLHTQINVAHICLQISACREMSSSLHAEKCYLRSTFLCEQISVSKYVRHFSVCVDAPLARREEGKEEGRNKKCPLRFLLHIWSRVLVNKAARSPTRLPAFLRLRPLVRAHFCAATAQSVTPRY